MTTTGASAAIETVVEYHERTKHHFDRYARSLGYLDWASQPDPFRRYEEAPLLPLARSEPGPAPPCYDDLYARTDNGSQAVTANSIAQFFYDSLAISAWKAIAGSRWSLRCNPSSGNLHPTEAYLICGPVEGLCDAPGLYHYTALEHALELRGGWPEPLWQEISAAAPAQSFFIGLSSIHWRESWKYGERAYRYCQHDVGHAIAALSFSALALGWSLHFVTGIDDDLLAGLLGIAAQRGPEAEHPDCLLAVTPGWRGRLREPVTLEPLAQCNPRTWEQYPLPQRPNDLSQQHQHWPLIDRVAAACRLSGASGPPAIAALRRHAAVPADPPNTQTSARQLMRQRRSAVAMDGHSSLQKNTFVRMLQRVLPASPPLTPLPGEPSVHLLLFVHRVEDLPAGLYLLVRSDGFERKLRSAMRREFLWEKVVNLPANLHLFRLVDGDTRAVASTVSCHQEIAADGAFAVAMLAEFQPRVEQRGAPEYRRLHWEAGAIGQVLYLEAEATGLRATGIGCFFDDAVHDLCGLAGRDLQDLYHFTVGGAVEDDRITTLPAYSSR